MKTLAIETSGKTFSVALAEGRSLVGEIFWQAGMNHSERLLPAVDRLLTEAGWKALDIEKIAVTTGPGSFTGIRVGLSCARTMAQHLKTPLAGFDTLTVLSAGIPTGFATVVTAIDALRDEVYIKIRDEVVIMPVSKLISRIRAIKGPVILSGSAGIQYRTVIEAARLPHLALAPDPLNYPRAGVLALMAHEHSGESYQAVKPLYIRRSWAEERPPKK